MEFFHFCNGLCYNWQEAITLNSFHIIPFYWVVWSLSSRCLLLRLPDICNVVGIDRGINFIAATYDSKHKSGFVRGRSIKQKRAHYSALRKELQMRHTPSSRRRLKSIGQRENRWMQDVNHCVSKALVVNKCSVLSILLNYPQLKSQASGSGEAARYGDS